MAGQNGMMTVTQDESTTQKQPEERDKVSTWPQNAWDPNLIELHGTRLKNNDALVGVVM